MHWFWLLFLSSTLALGTPSGHSPHSCLATLRQSASSPIYIELDECPQCHFSVRWRKDAQAHAQNHFLAPGQQIENKLRFNPLGGNNISTTVFPEGINFEQVFGAIEQKRYTNARAHLRLLQALEHHRWEELPLNISQAAVTVDIELNNEHFAVRVVSCLSEKCEIEKGVFVSYGDLVTLYPECGPGVQSVRFSHKQQRLRVRNVECAVE